MKPLFDLTLLPNMASTKLVPLECEECGETFHRMAKEVRRYTKVAPGTKGHINGGVFKYCSQKCSGLAQYKTTPRISVPCEECKTMMHRRVAETRKSKHLFCSHHCATKWQNEHKTTGTRRSKLEVWFEAQLTTIYPGLDMHFNRKEAINSELDIYIPSLQLAIELNGIFHYEPIYGLEKLAYIQNNDDRKFQACIERGIELLIIDISSISNFKEARALPFLTIVKQVIDNKLAVV